MRTGYGPGLVAAAAPETTSTATASVNSRAVQESRIIASPRSLLRPQKFSPQAVGSTLNATAHAPRRTPVGPGRAGAQTARDVARAAVSGATHRGRTETALSGLRVLGARAALGRGEAAALRGDRSALD